VQTLLKAKIDAWCSFDFNLQARKSSLEPAFVHCLGLRRFRPAVLSLLEIAHAEDVPSLQLSLTQLKAGRDECSLPALTRVRLRYGALGSIIPPVEQHMTKYIPFEVLMSWRQENSILVGLTESLERLMPEAVPFDPDLSQALNSHPPKVSRACSSPTGNSEPVSYGCAEVGSRPDYVLNGSDVISTTEDDAVTFRSVYADSHRGGQVVGRFDQTQASAFPICLSLAMAEVGAQSGQISTTEKTDVDPPSEANNVSGSTTAPSGNTTTTI